MKGKPVMTGMVIALTGLILTGCRSTDEEYKNDLDELLSMGENIEDAMDKDDMDDMLELYQDAVDDAEVSTREGRTIRDDFKKLSELIEDTYELIADTDSDEDDREELEEDLEDLGEDMEKHLKEFENAAQNAGLSKEEAEEIENLDIEF